MSLSDLSPAAAPRNDGTGEVHFGRALGASCLEPSARRREHVLSDPFVAARLDGEHKQSVVRVHIGPCSLKQLFGALRRRFNQPN
jgi:hypothetical protein